MKALKLSAIQELNVCEPEFIDVDIPFDAKEVEDATSRSYVEHLTRSDMPLVAARPVFTAGNKQSRAAMPTEHVFDPIDVDMPFSAAEVAALTCEAFVAALGPSDMPVASRWR